MTYYLTNFEGRFDIWTDHKRGGYVWVKTVSGGRIGSFEYASQSIEDRGPCWYATKRFMSEHLLMRCGNLDAIIERATLELL